MDFTELFCDVDDFVKCSHSFMIVQSDNSRRGVKASLSLSEIMTIIIGYHQSNFKNFKSYYYYLLLYYRDAFPKLVSYNRFVEIFSCALIPLCAYLNSRKGQTTGISFIDSTSITVCHNRRIQRNRVFQSMATRGKTTMGWFYGFKLHLIVNHLGELLSFKITKGNTDDRVPVMNLCKNISGKLYGDKGYIGKKLFEDLFENGVELITGLKKKMKNKLMALEDKILLRKRFIIETINDQLKNISDIDHTRHRSPINFLVNLIAGLIAYTHQAKKPHIKMVDPIHVIE